MGIGTIFILAVAITTVISPNLTDPVILPKFLLLLVVTVPLFIYTSKADGLMRFNLGRLASWEYLRNNTILVFATLFLSIHGFSALVSQSPTTAVFGISGRRNGFLTYLAFFLLFLLARRFANKESLNSLLFALSCVGGFEAIYMLIQKIGLDPSLLLFPSRHGYGFENSAWRKLKTVGLDPILLKSQPIPTEAHLKQLIIDTDGPFW